MAWLMGHPEPLGRHASLGCLRVPPLVKRWRCGIGEPVAVGGGPRWDFLKEMPMSPVKLVVTAGALALVGACSESHDHGLLPPPPVDQGVQLQMVAALAPGVETERCQFFKVPAAGYNISREEIRFTNGSHHVLLFTTPYADIPTKDRFGNPVNTAEGQWFECGPNGPTAHWEVNGVVGGSQNHDGVSLLGQLPAGTALKVPGGSVLLMNTHYINATAKVIDTDARINVYTIPDAQVQQEAGILFFYNPFIRVPANGKGMARAVCQVHQDINLVNGQSHMHKRGIKQETFLVDAQGAVADTLFKGTNWEDVPMQKNEPVKVLKAGQFIDYGCQYQNNEARSVTQGLSTQDEMCMFVGLYYPRHRQTELCGLSDQWDDAFFGARWVGNGVKNGIDTAACFMAAKFPEQDKGDSLYGCVVDSCAGISAPMSDTARCLATQGMAQCAAACETSAEACQTCVGAKCRPALQALASASCQ